MKKLLLALLFVSIANVVSAQTAVTTSKIGWDQDAPSLAEAQSYTYKYYPDSAQGNAILANATCSGAGSPFQCQAPFPAFTPGPHTLTLTASNIAGESAQSSPLSFVFVVTPSVPKSLRIIQQ